MDGLNKLYFIGVFVAALAAIVIYVTPMKEYGMTAVQFRIARPTNNLEAVTRFYRDGLGLETVGGSRDHDGYEGIMFGLPDHKHHLEFFAQRNAIIELPIASDQNWLVFYFDKPEEFLAANARLQEVMNITPVEPKNPYWKGRSETYEDPDNWRVVLFNGPYKP